MILGECNAMEIGLLLGRIREINNISLHKISQGICDLSTLTKFETGQRSIEKLAFEAIYQRLGKYSGRFETVLDNDEYDLMLMRWEIVDYIDEKKYDEAMEVISSYKKIVANNNLHLQYITFIECEIMHKTNTNLELRIKMLKEALQYTHPDFSINDMINNYYSRIELYIIAQYARYMQLSGEKERAANIYHSIIETIEREIYDRSEMEMHYRHVGLWLMEYYMDIQNYAQALNIGVNTFQHIKSGGFVSLLTETLENIIICKEYLGENVSNGRKYIDVLKRFVEVYEIQTIDDYFPRYVEERVYNVNDIIRQRRKMKGLKQEEILDEGCSRRTINRIENNKATTQKKTREFLLNKLKFPVNKYIAVVDTFDYTVYRLYNKVKDLFDSGEFSHAEEILRKMETEYKFDTINSKQFFFSKYNDVSIGIKNEYINTIDEMKEILAETIGDIDKANLKDVIMLENEWSIVKQIAELYKREDLKAIGNDKNKNPIFGTKCLDLLTPIDESYGKNSIHHNPYMYMYLKRKMGDILGEMGKTTEANEHAISGLKAMSKVDFLPYIYLLSYIYAWNVLEKKDDISENEKKQCVEMLQYAYVVASIYKNKCMLGCIESLCNEHSICLNLN